MTDYAKVLYDLLSSKDGQAHNVEKISRFLDRTEAEAMLIEDKVRSSLQEACKAMGTVIDSVPTFDGMQADVIGILLARLPDHMIGVVEHMLAAAAGNTTTPGCDCEVCKIKLNLEAQLRATHERPLR